MATLGQPGGYRVSDWRMKASRRFEERCELYLAQVDGECRDVKRVGYRCMQITALATSRL